uniref:Uncharacterized protein n=1 Tax=Anguilla anguilla TaxID=7936 RepID=A0A0E9WIF1_ANGAN
MPAKRRTMILSCTVLHNTIQTPPTSGRQNSSATELLFGVLPFPCVAARWQHCRGSAIPSKHCGQVSNCG